MGILLPIPFFRRILCYPPRLELVLCQAKKKDLFPHLHFSLFLFRFHPHMYMVLPSHDANTILSFMTISYFFQMCYVPSPF